MQTQRDVHCGITGRDTGVVCWMKGGMLEAAGPEMEGELVSVLQNNRSNRMNACMSRVKIVVFENYLKGGLLHRLTQLRLCNPTMAVCTPERQRMP